MPMKRLVQEKKEKTDNRRKINCLLPKKKIKRSFTNCGVKQNVKKKDYFLNIKQVNQFFR